MEYDAVVVGSGPGGASAARELCRAGKRVIMLEYGSDSEWLGNHLSALYKIGVKDTISGTIDTRGRINKRIEPEVQRRLQVGDERAREILLKAGVKRSSLVTSPVKATHPGGSARIGSVVDTNLETKIKNCYVADASIVPGELGRPVVLLALCIGKYAAEGMLENWS